MRSFNHGRSVASALALLVLLPLSSTATLAESATPFAQLSGAWHGSGQVRWSDGSNGHVNCRGNYSEKAGTELTLVIRCEAEGSKIDMRSNISYEGGRLSGTWSEKNFGLEGEVAGASVASKFTVRITGQLQGTMTVALTGATHTVTIATGGPGFKSVSINFSRG